MTHYMLVISFPPHGHITCFRKNFRWSADVKVKLIRAYLGLLSWTRLTYSVGTNHRYVHLYNRSFGKACQELHMYMRELQSLVVVFFWIQVQDSLLSSVASVDAVVKDSFHWCGNLLLQDLLRKQTHLNRSCSESRSDRCHFIAHINRQMLQQSTVLITITPCIISKSSLVNLHLYSLCIYSTFSTFWTPHSHNGSLPPEPVI